MGSSAHPSNPRKPLACRGDRIASARPVACLDSVRGSATHGGFDATAPGVRLVRRVLCLAGAGPTVGRAGLSVQALLVVLPVNFVTLGRSAVFPTVPAPSSTPRRRMRSWRLRPAATSATGRVAGGCESGARQADLFTRAGRLAEVEAKWLRSGSLDGWGDPSMAVEATVITGRRFPLRRHDGEVRSPPCRVHLL